MKRLTQLLKPLLMTLAALLAIALCAHAQAALKAKNHAPSVAIQSS
jgi:hypothetical protein